MLKTHEKIEALINDLIEDIDWDMKNAEYINRVYLIDKWTIWLRGGTALIRCTMYRNSVICKDVVYHTSNKNEFNAEIEAGILDVIGDK